MTDKALDDECGVCAHGVKSGKCTECYPPKVSRSIPGFRLTAEGEWLLIRMVAQPQGEERKTSGGIIAPDNAASMESVGRAYVYSAGPDVTSCEPGQVVILKNGPAFPVLHLGKQYVYVHMGFVLGVDLDCKAEPDGELILSRPKLALASSGLSDPKKH